MTYGVYTNRLFTRHTRGKASPLMEVAPLASRTLLRVGRGLAGLSALLVAVTVAVAGCGAPQFTYVANSSANTYFKVPYGWHPINRDALSKELGSGSGAWSVAYDAGPAPSAAHAFSFGISQPFVFALVGQLSTTESNQISYNGLRDFVFPVTSAARQTATKDSYPLTNFQLISDSVLNPGQGIHGVRDVFSYTYPDGSVDTFDQVAYLNADSTKVYVLMIHCQTRCYSENVGEINQVMTSFTVRSS
jgi:hypothetical protein